MKAIYCIIILYFLKFTLLNAMDGQDRVSGNEESGNGQSGSAGRKRPSSQIAQSSSGAGSGSSGGQPPVQNPQNVQPTNPNEFKNSSIAAVYHVGALKQSANPGKLSCNYCPAEFAIKKGGNTTSNILDHLRTQHGLGPVLNDKTNEYKKIFPSIWDRFDKKDRDTAICRECNNKVSMKNNNTNHLFTHEKRNHGEIYDAHITTATNNMAAYLGEDAAENHVFKEQQQKLVEWKNYLATKSQKNQDTTEQQTIPSPLVSKQLANSLSEQIQKRPAATSNRPKKHPRAQQGYSYSQQQKGHSRQKFAAQQIASTTEGQQIRPSISGRRSSQRPQHLSEISFAQQQQMPHSTVPQQSVLQIAQNIARSFRPSAMLQGQQIAQPTHIGMGSISRQIAEQNVATPSNEPQKYDQILDFEFDEDMQEIARLLNEENLMEASALQKDQQTAQQIPVTQHMMQQLHVTQPQHQQGQLIGQSITQPIASSAGEQMQPSATISARPSGNLSGMLNRMTTQIVGRSSQIDKGKGIADESQPQPQTQRRSTVGGLMPDARRTGTYPIGYEPPIPRRSTQQRTIQPGQMISFGTGTGTMPPPSSFTQGGATRGHLPLRSVSRTIQQHHTFVTPGTGHFPQAPSTQHQPSRLGSGSISRQITQQSFPVPSSPSINFGVTPEEITSFLGERPTPSASQGGHLPSRSISRQIAHQSFPVPASPSLAFGESMAEGARQLYEEDEVQSAPQGGTQSHVRPSSQLAAPAAGRSQLVSVAHAQATQQQQQSHQQSVQQQPPTSDAQTPP